MMSPTLMPMRNSIRRSSETSALLGHAALDFHGAAHRIDGACKLNQGTVTRGLDDAAAMLRDLGIDDFAPVRLECSKRAFLVEAHQPAVAGDIGSKDGCQPPFDTRFGHKDRPPLA